MRFLVLKLLPSLMGLLFCAPWIAAQAPQPLGPAFTSVPELESGYRLLYQQKFPEAREVFQKWMPEQSH